MGYNEPPLPTPYDTYCNSDKVNFFVTLMIKSKGNEKGEYVPKYPKAKSGNESSESNGASDSSSSSDSDEFTSPTPKFKVGDKVKFWRNAKQDAIRRTGTITKVKSTRPDPIQSWNDCKNKSSVKTNRSRDGWFHYEIGSPHEPEPGVWTRSYEFCDEELIHLLNVNEMLDHEDTLHGLQRNEPNLSYSLNQRNNKSDTKPVAKPIKSKIKSRNPKIEENSTKIILIGLVGLRKSMNRLLMTFLMGHSEIKDLIRQFRILISRRHLKSLFFDTLLLFKQNDCV
jgi:hypothetical protein